MSDVGPRQEVQSNKEFSPEERAALRKMLSANKFRVMFWQAVGVWLKWIFFVVAGLVSVKVLLAEYLKR
jgi:hypothetical protein